MQTLTGLAIMTALAALAPARAQDDAAAGTLPGWMAGCWLTDAPQGRRSEECWTAPRGAMMLGSGHMFENGRSLSFEHMRIMREGTSLVFVAQPGGTPPTRFPLESRSATEVRFLNADHDYPQRVTYRLANGALEAEIAMKDGARAMRWTFRQP